MNKHTTGLSLAAVAACVIAAPAADAAVTVVFEGVSSGSGGSGEFSLSFELDTAAAQGAVGQFDASFTGPGSNGLLNAATRANANANPAARNTLSVFQGGQAGPFSSYGISMTFSGTLDSGEAFTASAELISLTAQDGNDDLWWQGVTRELTYFGGDVSFLFPTVFDSDDLPTLASQDFVRDLQLSIDDGSSYTVTRVYAVPAPAGALAMLGAAGVTARRRRR